MGRFKFSGLFNRRGSQDAIYQEFSNIYQTHRDNLYLYAYRFLVNEEEARDVVHHVMLKLWEQREKLSEIASVKSYLFRAVHNACVNRLEHNKIRNRYLSENGKELMRIEMESYTGDRYPFDIHEQVSREIDKLPPRIREIMLLRYAGGLRYKEIAKKLNISERTVETHLQQGVKILRSIMKEKP